MPIKNAAESEKEQKEKEKSDKNNVKKLGMCMILHPILIERIFFGDLSYYRFFFFGNFIFTRLFLNYKVIAPQMMLIHDEKYTIIYVSK